MWCLPSLLGISSCLRFAVLRRTLNLVRAYESKLLNYCLNQPLTDELNVVMRADLAAGGIDETYCDHFIHPFQDFLLGATMLDTYQHDFQQWHPTSLNSTQAQLKFRIGVASNSTLS